MNRYRNLIRRVALVGLALSFTACGARDGEPEADDTPDLEAGAALRLRFPAQAARVLEQEETFEAKEEGLSLKPVEGGSWRSLELTLPHDGASSAQLRAPGGFEVRVRELGAQGKAKLTESTVTYQRAGGTSFWTAAPGGYEEWLYLSDAGAGAAIAAWEIEGAVTRQLGDEVAVVDEGGVPRILVSAPSAYAAGGAKVRATLKAEGARIELFVEAKGEVLVDPVWNAAASMHKPRYGHSATLLSNGTVLVAGGYDTFTSIYQPSSEVYLPSSNTWLAPAPMSTGRYAHTATLLPDGKVLVTGGWDGHALNLAEVYDTSSGMWAVVPQPMNAAHHSHTATLLGNGKVLVVGGVPENGVPEVYDPTDQSFHLTGPMGTLRQNHTATLLSTGEVLIAGGSDIVGVNFLNSTELYDPATGPWGTWTPGPSMSTGRADHTATRFANGTLLVAGGRGVGGMLTSAELYLPFENAWSSVVGSLSTARSTHTATLLPSGKVLVAGGFVDSSLQTTDSAELFDPTTNVWTSAGSMSIVRSQHTATALPSGTVLVTGGFGNGLQASTELYTEPPIPPSPFHTTPVCLSLRRGARGNAQDAMINQEAGHTADNHGATTLLASGVIDGTRRQSLYRWNLSLVPPGATVLNASVTLNVSSSGAGSPQVHRITAPWNEHTVSWDSFNGAFDPAVVASFDNGYPASPAITFDMLPTAKGWVDGSIPNRGLLIEQAGPSYTRVKSSEWGAGSLRPTLNLCYQLACAPGFADCDGDGRNGCETSLSGAGNCGG